MDFRSPKPSVGTPLGRSDLAVLRELPNVPTADGIPLFAPEVAISSEDYDPDWYQHLSECELGHFWFENRNQLIIRNLCSHFPSAEEFLEVGCGTGFVLDGVARARPGLGVTGTELHIEGLRYAQGRVPSARLFQADARNLPFADAFDVIGMFDVVEHIEDHRAVLASARSALRSRGGLMLTVPQHPWLWSTIDEVSGHKRRYTANQLHTLVEEAGFSVIHSTSFVSSLVPLIWLSRNSGRRLAPRQLVKRQFEVGAFTNSILSAALGIERAILGTGISLPFGSSRLVVAERRT